MIISAWMGQFQRPRWQRLQGIYIALHYILYLIIGAAHIAGSNSPGSPESTSHESIQLLMDATESPDSPLFGSMSDSELDRERLPPKKPVTPRVHGRDDWLYEYTDEVDVTVDFLYQPRSILLLMLLFGGLLVYSFYDAESPVANTKRGLVAAFLILGLVGILQFRDSPYVRPHPAFWRLVLACSVSYQLVLVVILFQNKVDARAMLKYLDPSLGFKLPERSYANACDLTWDNIYDTLDIFVVAHSVGWFAKALIIRDYWLCWIMSILFEVLEYTFAHQLPNFAECWWDHWILDVLLTNWAGLYLGMKTCEYFEMKAYSWRGVAEIPSVRGKLKRTLQQLTPHSFTRFEWKTTQTLKNYVTVIAMLYVGSQVELNAFYLKYLLWVPPEHPLNTYRLILFFFMVLPATRELYQYVHDTRCNRLGMHAWMVCTNIGTELLICIKFGRGEFPAPFPTPVKIFWAIVSCLLVAYPTYQFGLAPMLIKGRKRKDSLASNSTLYVDTHAINGGSDCQRNGRKRLAYTPADASSVNCQGKNL
ncbi:hypothetical protein SeLEV6574_g00792 [Synchytrium endobioticum]|uniref:Phosphatidylserine synthase n=1 Tax=Synchytrium endobioticum TaxID=286115 RepID=A0A507DGA0_9FUNG|nr:hypothetical protein SeLEV6574_g00792 [Synchytrium endobioticum]